MLGKGSRPNACPCVGIFEGGRRERVVEREGRGFVGDEKGVRDVLIIMKFISWMS